MGFSVRSLGLVSLLALVLTPAIAAAQGAPPPAATALPPPPGGGTTPGGGAGGAAGSGGATSGGAAAAKPADDSKSTGNVGGVSFNDKPVRRAPTQRTFRSVSGPLATFPGYEQLPDGGSRLFVQVSQAVPVEERKASGSVTYVLKGAHLRVNNDANALVTVHFNTPVFRARLTPQGNDLLFVLELRAAVAPTFKLSPNPDKTSTLQIDFAKGDFITGDGSELLPSERRPEKGLGRAGRRGKGANPRQAPPRDDNDNNNDPNGPTP